MSKQRFLDIAAKHYEELERVGKEPDFFALEGDFDKIWTEFGRQTLEDIIGEVPKDTRKKTSCEPGTGASK
jgi:hypothetical protein